MKTDAIQVAIDILRELGREEEARWLENPEAVRELTKHAPVLWVDTGPGCPVCSMHPEEAHRWVLDEAGRLAPCPIAAAWRALGDPRGAADIERAHEEALRQNRPHAWATSLRNAEEAWTSAAGRAASVQEAARRGAFPDIRFVAAAFDPYKP